MGDKQEEQIHRYIKKTILQSLLSHRRTVPVWAPEMSSVACRHWYLLQDWNSRILKSHEEKQVNKIGEVFQQENQSKYSRTLSKLPPSGEKEVPFNRLRLVGQVFNTRTSLSRTLLCHRLLLFENEAKLRVLNFGWPFNGGKDNRKPSSGWSTILK